MKRFPLYVSWAVMALALILLVAHTFQWDAVKVDATTLALMGLILIAPLLRHVRRIRVGDVEAELDQLGKATRTAEATLSIAPSPGYASQELEPNTTREIAELASSSPKSALILLSAEIEREVRDILASMGWLQGREHQPVSLAIEGLNQHGSAPKDLVNALRIFLDTRNRVIHAGSEADEAFRAVDFGLTILRMLRGIPRETNVVFHPGVELYSDPDGKNPIPEVRGVILETTSAGGLTRSHRIFPTTRGHFERGKRVAWEWSDKNQWDAAWYRDPDTGEIRKAWDGSLEFVGRNVDEFVDEAK